MALGASQAAVRTMVLRQAGRLGVLGAMLGVVLALALARLVQHLGLLVGVSPADPWTFLGVAIGMGLVLLAASYLPARRAATTDPATALRAQ